MAILSVQSHVASGHVGNSAAVFSLQRLGHDVWPVNTVQFSNHPGHGAFSGEAEAPSRVQAILRGLEEHGCWENCEAVLSGYLGHAVTGQVLSEAVSSIKVARPEAIFLCDPVIGDGGEGIYVASDVVDIIRRQLVPQADFLFPNTFELGVLTGRTLNGVDDVVSTAKDLLSSGPKGVIVSSVVDDATDSKIKTFLVMADKVVNIETPEIPFSAKGAGDFLAALWLGRYLQSGNEADALELAVSSLFAMIEKTGDADGAELPLVRHQTLITDPPHRISASR